MTRGSEEDGGKGGDDLVVPCPKCRKETLFEHCRRDDSKIAVNHEMQAIVNMMVTMLRQQSKRSSNNNSRESGEGASLLPPLGRPSAVRRSTSRERRRVSFTGEAAAGDDDDVLHASPPSSRNGGRPTSSSGVVSGESEPSLSRPTTSSSSRVDDGQGDKVANSIVKLVQLEKELKKKREEQKLERERIAKAKADEYKRQRQEWIEQRNQEVLAKQQQDEDEETKRANADGDDDLHVVRTVDAGAHYESPYPHPKSRSELLQNIQSEDHAHFSAERKREIALHRQVRQYLGEQEEHSSIPRGGRNAMTEHSVATSLHPNHAALSSSAKAREAESRVMHLYRAPTEEEYRIRREHERLLREQQEEEELKQKKSEMVVDEEIERKLQEVEVQVRQQHEAELSRAQMAEIAELRARQTIAKYAAQGSPKAPLPKPTYKPKLNRLQTFS